MKTVRVRVFVRVGYAGSWQAFGCSAFTPQMSESACNHIAGDGYWIEADLPLPNQAPEIVATVTRA